VVLGNLFLKTRKIFLELEFTVFDCSFFSCDVVYVWQLRTDRVTGLFGLTSLEIIALNNKLPETQCLSFMCLLFLGISYEM
jgi:hypothetical protein